MPTGAQDGTERALTVVGSVSPTPPVRPARNLGRAIGFAGAFIAESVRFFVAFVVALAADTVQFLVLPLFMGGAASPLNDMLDVFVAVVMVALLGLHWQFLPSFVAELVPVLNIAPAWTIAVLWVRQERRAAE